LQAFQAVEAAVRQFYFSYQQLVVAVMGSGEYKGSAQTEISAADALSQIYFEPPYFPSLDGAKTFLGNYWHNSRELEEGAIMKHLVVEKATMDRIIKTSSITSSNSGDSTKDTDEEMASKVHPYSFHTVVCYSTWCETWVIKNLIDMSAFQLQLSPALFVLGYLTFRATYEFCASLIGYC
jgi:hypothetical protein